MSKVKICFKSLFWEGFFSLKEMLFGYLAGSSYEYLFLKTTFKVESLNP